jgi:hypothetical protein
MDTSSFPESSNPADDSGAFGNSGVFGNSGASGADERLALWLDVCRPSGADLELPEFAPLAHAITHDETWRARWQTAQVADNSLRRKLEDLPLSPGLEARLRQKLGLADAAAPVVNSAASSDEPVVSPVVPGNSQRRWRTRRWFSLAGLASVALATLGAVAFWQAANRPTLPDSPETLARLGEQWAAMARGASQWDTQLSELPGGRDGRALVAGERTRWRVLRTNCDRQTYVVEVQQGDVAAWLFSFRGSLPFMKNFLAPARVSASGESDVWAWSDGTFVFMLVAQNRELRLDSWIRRPQFAISPPLPAHVPPSQSPKSLQAERPLLSARHDGESRVRGVACVGFHGSSWAFW